MADSDGKGVTAELPPASDRLTAQMFGARVARAALRWKLGARMAADA